MAISRLLGRHEGLQFPRPNPQLRKQNRIRTVQGIWAIEGKPPTAMATNSAKSFAPRAASMSRISRSRKWSKRYVPMPLCRTSNRSSVVSRSTAARNAKFGKRLYLGHRRQAQTSSRLASPQSRLASFGRPFFRTSRTTNFANRSFSASQTSLRRIPRKQRNSKAAAMLRFRSR